MIDDFLHERITEARLSAIEAAAQIADRHKGAARAERVARAKHRPRVADDPAALTEILAEERGEDIAADMISEKIRALKGSQE